MTKTATAAPRCNALRVGLLGVFLSVACVSALQAATTRAAPPTGTDSAAAASDVPAQQLYEQFVGGTLTNCFFKYGPTGADPLNNRAFPDFNAVYWAASYVRPQGAKVEIEGMYPYARFMSFISYDKVGLFVDGTADYMINPNPGSVNTFRPGASRYSTPEDKRTYTVEVRLAEKPADLPLVQNAGQPPRNYLYSLPSKNKWTDPKTGNPVETILYRIYVPDKGMDYAGGLPVPTVKVTLAGGNVLHGQDACDALRSDPKSADEVFTPELSALVMPPQQWEALAHPKGVPNTFPARYPADWRGACDPDYNKDAFALKPKDYQADSRLPTPRKFGGSYYPNVFNTYLRTFINRNIGRVVVIQFKPWTTVKTYRHDAVFTDTGEMRFWSISLSESQATTRVVSGVFDEQFPINGDGYITFVASNQKDRSKYATTECGVAWANWKDAGDGVGNSAFGWLSIRNMLPKPGTTDNNFALQRPGDEQRVLGEYYPQLKYFKDAAAFDALGCAGVATRAATRGIPTKGSSNAIGWPYKTE